MFEGTQKAAYMASKLQDHPQDGFEDFIRTTSTNMCGPAGYLTFGLDYAYDEKKDNGGLGKLLSNLNSQWKSIYTSCNCPAQSNSNNWILKNLMDHPTFSLVDRPPGNPIPKAGD